MKWNQIESQWHEFTGSARAQWSKLTDEDWRAMSGSKGHLAGRIQKRYGVTREESERQIDEWSISLMNIAEAPSTN